MPRMDKSFAATLRQLNEDPAVIKASGIGEERTLILDMLEEMSANPESVFGLDAREIAGLVSSMIRNGDHRKEFGQ